MPVRTSYHPCPGPFLLLACVYKGSILLNEVLNVSLLADRVQSPGLDLVLPTSVQCTHMQLTCPLTQRDTYTHSYRKMTTHTQTHMHLQACTDTQSHTFTHSHTRHLFIPTVDLCIEPLCHTMQGHTSRHLAMIFQQTGMPFLPSFCLGNFYTSSMT